MQYFSVLVEILLCSSFRFRWKFFCAVLFCFGGNSFVVLLARFCINTLETRSYQSARHASFGIDEGVVREMFVMLQVKDYREKAILVGHTGQYIFLAIRQLTCVATRTNK